ncbi:hypothetical protein O9X98_09770 [Agrobacterium salinitolerans]|nr:hypothetical protein [Agrobacterium salinitolerans]
MALIAKNQLSGAELEVLTKIPSHTFVAATTFIDAVTSAGMTWDDGKAVLASLLQKELIVDLNEDTLDDDYGVCDRTPLGDLVLGVYISIQEEKAGTFKVSNPLTYHQRVAGGLQGSVYYSDSYENALLTAKSCGVLGATIVVITQNGEVTPVDYLETSQDSCSIGNPAPNVSWNWKKLKSALELRAEAFAS